MQPYIDEESIDDHLRPWKQMLMFFARTQKEHDWRSPEYQFTCRQREAWVVLVREAKRKVSGVRSEEGEEEGEDTEDGKDSNTGEYTNYDKNDQDQNNQDNRNNQDD